MASFREKTVRFLSGRYGPDALYYVCTALALAFAVAYLIFRRWFLYPPAILLILWSAFRSFSRNKARRQRENAVFLRVCRRVGAFFKLNANRIAHPDRVFRRCPACGAVLRLPRIRGRHRARCPRCSGAVDVRVLLGKRSGQN